jgi:hypothetical protein
MNDINILVPVNVDPFLLIDHMCLSMTYEQLRDFVVILDERIADWDFTLMLEEYFSEQLEKYMEDN